MIVGRFEVTKVEEDSNIDFELNIRIEAAIAAASAAKNELEAIKNAQDKEKEAEADAKADVKAAVTEAVKVTAKNALIKATEAAEAVAKKEADVKAAVAAVEEGKEAAVAEAKEAAVAEEEAVVKAAVTEAVIAAIAALTAIYTEVNNDRRDPEITEGERKEGQEGQGEGALVVNNSSKEDKAQYFLAVNEIVKIMDSSPSQKQNKRALDVVVNPTFTEDTDDKKLAKAAATVAADYVKNAIDEQRDSAIAKAIEKIKSAGGKSAPKYKSTGQVVNIMYKKRKYKRTIFVKEKRKTKYCKINNEYILLSKLNVL
jgi:hypothetical protein